MNKKARIKNVKKKVKDLNRAKSNPPYVASMIAKLKKRATEMAQMEELERIAERLAIKEVLGE